MTRQPRRKRQGAVLVEGLIAVATILIFFGATLFFHDMFKSKGFTMRVARHQAWAGTRPGCSQFDDIQGAQSGTVELPSTLRDVDAPKTISLSSSTAMECNVQPEPHDDALAAISSIMALWSL